MTANDASACRAIEKVRSPFENNLRAKQLNSRPPLTAFVRSTCKSVCAKSHKGGEICGQARDCASVMVSDEESWISKNEYERFPPTAARTGETNAPMATDEWKRDGSVITRRRRYRAIEDFPIAAE